MTRLIPVFRFVLAAALVLGVSSRASAQLDLTTQDPRQMLADQLVLLMQQSLAGDGLPSEDQLTRASVLLNLALNLAPGDADLWRLKVELSDLRRRPRDRFEAIEKLVALEPQNDALQLELILTRAASQQTLEGRLMLVERVLDAPASRSLSAPLRSRLSSYAAAAARELGDDAKFGRRLTDALRLDSANADAARMAYDLSVQRKSPATHRGAALIGWVRAMPADPMPRFLLGELLMREAVYEEAAQQFDMSAALAQGPPSVDQLRLWVMSLAMSGQMESAVGLLDQIDRAMQAAPPPPAEDGAPTQPQTLPPQLQLLRLAIVSMTAQPETARPLYEQLREDLAALGEAGDVAAQRDLALAAAVFAQDLDGAEGLLPDDANEATRQLIRGWIALRYGREAEGAQLLRPLAEVEPLAALGMSLLEQDPAAKASLLEAVLRRDPIGMAGLLAAINLRKLERPIPPTPTGISMRDSLQRWPGRIWYTNLTTTPWMSMQLRVQPPRAGFLDPLKATAIISNLSGSPISVGDAGGIPRRLILSVTPTTDGAPQPPLPPMIVDIGRKITLAAGERLEVPFRLDRAEVGQYLLDHATVPLSLQATIVLDPQTTPEGGVRPGPLGAIDSIRTLQITSSAITAPNIEAWLTGLDSRDRAEQLRAIARLLKVLASDLPIDVDAEATRTRIGEAINSRFPTFNPTQQAWTLRFLPPADRLPENLQPAVDLAQRSNEPLVRVVYLAAQVTDPESPAMTAALRHEDPVIGEFARALRSALTTSASEPGAGTH